MAKKTEKQKNEEGLKIQSFSAENYKSITKVSFNTQGGKSFRVIGANGAGKSSMLQIMLANMDTKLIPSKPIKKGEERAVIECVIAGEIDGEPRKYTIEHFFTPGNQTGRLVVTDGEGASVKSPSTTIKNLVGGAGFNIYKDFLNADKKTRIKLLKRLTGKEKEIDLAEIDIATKMVKKGKLKDNIEDAESSMKNHGFSDEDIEKYSEPIDTEAIQAELTNVSKAIDSYNYVTNGVADMEKSNASFAARKVSILDEIEEIKMEAQRKIDKLTEEGAIGEVKVVENNGKIEAAKQWLKGKEKPSAEAIGIKMSEAATHNQNHERVNQFAAKQLELLNKKKEFEKLETEIKKDKAAKDKIISESELPIDGLTFDEDEILLDGINLEEGQVNTAKLIDIGISIYAALNPNLRVIFIPEGSLLDSHTMAAIEKKWVDELNYQIIVECVAENNEAEIQFIESREEGEVKGE